SVPGPTGIPFRRLFKLLSSKISASLLTRSLPGNWQLELGLLILCARVRAPVDFSLPCSKFAVFLLLSYV
ncbi:hypothetical protein QQP08_021479, partial [Theobroma cacao]